MVATDGETGTGSSDSQKIPMSYLWKKRNECPNVGAVSIRSRNGASSQTGCVVNGQMTKARNK